DPRANLPRKILYSLTQRPDPGFILDRLRHAGRWASVDQEFAKRFPGADVAGRIRHVEHHRAHLASSFFVSPFEEAVAVSVDGSGDFASAAWGVGRGGRIEIDGRVPFPHSLGIFYEAMTQHLGFPHYGDEYKVMGLAPYGEPAYVEKLRDVLRLRPDGSVPPTLDYFVFQREGRLYEWNDWAPSPDRLANEGLERIVGPWRAPEDPLEQRHKDIARSVQRLYEEAFFNLLNRLHERYKLPHLVLSGG